MSDCAEWRIVDEWNPRIGRGRYTHDLGECVEFPAISFGGVTATIDGTYYPVEIPYSAEPRTLRLDVERLPEWGYVVAVNVVEVEEVAR